jgi:hypothetical protein
MEVRGSRRRCALPEQGSCLRPLHLWTKSRTRGSVQRSHQRSLRHNERIRTHPTAPARPPRGKDYRGGTLGLKIPVETPGTPFGCLVDTAQRKEARWEVGGDVGRFFSRVEGRPCECCLANGNRHQSLAPLFSDQRRCKRFQSISSPPPSNEQPLQRTSSRVPSLRGARPVLSPSSGKRVRASETTCLP